ncbi:MAG: NAD(P)-dependent alcohol dehydrogenase [Bacteroidota bacterium]|jgi:NADPH:quinone reductase-like Zn-dependent oxidoreductase
MKAIVYHNYGSPDVLKCEEIEKPTAGDDEVLIKVRAASVNPLDWHYVRGIPYILRMMTGLSKPKNTRPGVDVAGKVETVGRNVTQFKPGDEVFGTSRGAFAEYVCSHKNKLVQKPAHLTFEQAAAVPVAGLTALQGLRDKGRIQAGQKVLINGAAGGVGTFAVQIAKSLGADVTGVCSTRNVDMVRSIGADHVIDYTKEDFTQSGQRYDLMFDNVGNRSFRDCTRAMVAKGIFVSNGGGSLRENEGTWLGPLAGSITELVSAPFVSQKSVSFLASINKQDLVVLKELMEAKKVTPVIDRCYTLNEVPEAIRYLEEGHARGKVVITVGHKNET